MYTKRNRITTDRSRSRDDVTVLCVVTPRTFDDTPQ